MAINGDAEAHRPDAGSVDALRLAAWRAVSSARDAVYSQLSTQMRARAGLPVEWYEVLLHLRETGGGSLRQSELERTATIGPTGVSRMLAKMQDAGLLTRIPTASDRRALDVTITAAGDTMLIRATPVYMATVQSVFGGNLDDSGAGTVARLLEPVAATAPDGSGGVAQARALVPFGETVLAVTEGAVAISDAIQVRNSLEPLLLVEAAQHVTAAGAGEMRSAVGRMSTLLDQPEEFFRADWQLHRIIAQLAKNATLKSIYLSLLDVIEAHLSHVLPTADLDNYLNVRLAVHARLVDAVCSGDVERVRQAAREHDFVAQRPLWLADAPKSTNGAETT